MGIFNTQIKNVEEYKHQEINASERTLFIVVTSNILQQQIYDFFGGRGSASLLFGQIFPTKQINVKEWQVPSEAH